MHTIAGFLIWCFEKAGYVLWPLSILVAGGLVWLYSTNPERVADRALKRKQERETARLRAKERRS